MSARRGRGAALLALLAAAALAAFAPAGAIDGSVPPYAPMTITRPSGHPDVLFYTLAEFGTMPCASSASCAPCIATRAAHRGPCHRQRAPLRSPGYCMSPRPACNCS